MHLSIDLLPHPVTTEGREIAEVAVEGATLADLVARYWRGPGAPVAAVNHGIIAPGEWVSRRPRPGDVVTLRAAVAGGDDTDPLRTVAQIAILVAAIKFGGPLGAAIIGGSATSAGAIALGSGLITFGGGLILDALIPAQLPDAGDAPSAAPAGEPSYSLAGGHNLARPYGPLPLVLGRHRMHPRLGAAPYTEYDGDDQYLYAIYHFGLGAPVVSDLRIGTNAIGLFQNVTQQWGDAAGRVSLVAGNVDSTEGGVLDSATVWTTRTAAAGATRVAIDLVARLFRIDDRGDYHDVTVNVEVELVADARVIRHIVALTHGSQSVYRTTLKYDLPATGVQPASGRWQVRCRRQAPPSPAERTFDDVTWQTMRSYQPDLADYTGQTRLGIRIRASGQLSGAIDRLSATVQQLVPVWDASLGNTGGWTAPRSTRNPAWIYRWFVRGIYAGGRLVAGAGLPESRIDDVAIRRWATWCAEQGWTCDYVIDRPMTIHRVLELIAACGRAAPTWSSGRLGVVWEDLSAPATASVTPATIVAGTFSVEYAGAGEADEVAVRYLDPAFDWQRQTIRRRAAGVTHPTRTLTLDAPGLTSGTRAARLANLALARQRYQRRRMRWRMGPAAMMAMHRGDVVHVSHALVDGGISGRCTALAGDTIHLDRQVALAAGDHSALLGLPDGRLHSAGVETGAGDTWSLTLDAAVPAPEDASRPFHPEDVVWRLYPDTDPPLLARIVGVEPLADGTVAVTAVDEPPEYRTAITSDLTTPTSAQAAAGRLPTIVSIYAWTEAVENTIGDTTEVFVEIEVAGAWAGGEVTVTAGPGAGPKGTIPPSARRLSWITARAGTLDIQVVPVGNPGGSRSIRYLIQGPPALPGLFDWRGDWSVGQAYTVNDIVGRGGHAYICLANHTSTSSNGPPSALYWDRLVVAGVRGAQGPAGAAGAAGADGNGVEFIYTAIPGRYSGPDIQTRDRPLDSWGFDTPGDLGPGRQVWSDGAPDLTATHPNLVMCYRGVPGTPARGATPPASGAWPRAGWTRWSVPRVVGRRGADGVIPQTHGTFDGAGTKGRGTYRWSHIADLRVYSGVTTLREADPAIRIRLPDPVEGEIELAPRPAVSAGYITSGLSRITTNGVYDYTRLSLQYASTRGGGRDINDARYTAAVSWSVLARRSG